MNIKVNTDNLLSVLEMATAFIGGYNNQNILSNTILTLRNNLLEIQAGDLQVNFKTTIMVNKQDDCEQDIVAVYFEKLLKIIRSFSKGSEIILQKKKKCFEIRSLSGAVFFSLRTLNHELYPEFHDMPKINYEIKKEVFLAMVNQTHFAISNDENRYSMNGVYLAKNGNELAMVATDGRRLAIVLNQCDYFLEDGIIIPVKIINILKKYCEDNIFISLSADKKEVFFKFGSFYIVSNLIQGKFPNYERVIPENNPNHFIVQTNVFYDALKRISIITERSKRIVLELSENNLIISTPTNYLGSGRESMECEYSGPIVRIALNYLYLMDPIKVMTGEKFKISFLDSKKAIIMTSFPESNYSHVIMPMKPDVGE